ncbi:MAG: hypothetical protein AAGG75_25795 [Bacteroidota bacterium]
MSLVHDTHRRLHEYALLKKLDSQRIQRQPADYEQSKSIGILFDATQSQHWMPIKKYAKTLREKGKKLKILAYFHDKHKHDEFPFHYFNRSQLDWLLRPVSSEVGEFIKQPFDVLMTLNQSASMALEYISALSRAQLRVGPYTEKTYCYDLMIETKDQQDLPNFIKEVEFYLNRMNSSTHENAAI